MGNAEANVLSGEALREKYRQERDKRLRSDGNEQYIKPTGKFAKLVKDRFIGDQQREAKTDEVKVAIIGAGFSGLTMGARLKEAGIDDIRLIDSAGDVGGVWYWNRYPGAMCDTAAMIYLPLLEETNYLPSKKYVFAEEIFDHAQRIAKQYDLKKNALFGTEVISIQWLEDESKWMIKTYQGDAFKAKYITMGTGPLDRPKLPGIPGIEKFNRHCFHTSRWDYDYTGGGPDNSPMEKLADKRVGIIGTGATAVQCIPQLARTAQDLFVFQRTPSSIDIRNNHELKREELPELNEGWQQEWLTNFATLQMGGMADKDLVKDGWTDITKRIKDYVIKVSQEEGRFDGDIMKRAFSDCDDEKMNEIRARVDEIVKNSEAAEALKPWYRQLCKRPCFHDEYLQAYNQDNVHLVDTNGIGVEAIDETGVFVDGKHYELDCLIFASGFEVSLAHSSSYDTIGKDGLKLTDYWENGMQSYHGIHVHNFPNLFISGLSQAANLVSNITHNLTEAASATASVIKYAEENGIKEVEASKEAQDKWVGQFKENALSMIGGPDCTPGYYNNEGQPTGEKERLNAASYPQGPVAYFKYLKNWSKEGAFKGLEFK
jgi:cation diffusion facilitator CzcD-associated flavoprotein CzcO